MNGQVYKLDFENTLKYFRMLSDESNSLFKELCQKIQWENGSFYTFLSKEININHIDWLSSDINFKCADQVVENFILKELITSINSDHSVIIEENLFKEKDISGEMFNIARNAFEEVGICKNEELYYLINKVDLLAEIFDYVRLQYPLIGIVTKKITDLDTQNQMIPIQSVIVGAYCSKGFIIWKNNQLSSFFDIKET